MGRRTGPRGYWAVFANRFTRWHHRFVRITFSLDDDAMKAVRAYARTSQLSIGRAASELIRRGVRYQLRTRKLNGLPVFDAPNDFPAITTKRVRQLLDAAAF